MNNLLVFFLSMLALLQGQTTTATLYQTYDDVAVFETLDGNLWEVYVQGELPKGQYELVFHGDEVINFFPDLD